MRAWNHLATCNLSVTLATARILEFLKLKLHTSVLQKYLLCCFLMGTLIFSGDYCQISKHSMTEEPSGTSTGVVVAIVIIIIAALVAITAYAYWYIRKSRRLKGRYKPSQMEQNGPGVVPGIPLDKILDPVDGERLI